MTVTPATDLDSAPGRIKVMLVDDSAVIRGLLARGLESDRDVRVVSSVSNGQMAVSAIKNAAPDIVVLDIEMPVMDGLTALPLLLQNRPGVKIVMCSTLTHKGATVSLKALSLGAAECMVKPTSTSEIGSAGEFQQNLLRLIKSLGAAQIGAASPAAQRRPGEPARFTLRNDARDYRGKPSLLAIGSSTGGPQALFTLMKNFRNFDIPIVITQHMPKTFTAILAEHIQANCGLPCREGAEGMTLEKGHAYIAPGGFHMELVQENDKTKIKLSDGPQENYCKPSVEPMMRSVIKIFGNKALAVILTGMGSDGVTACRTLAETGGRVVAQDEATSVVWGMPGAVAMAGICSAVLPLPELGPWVRHAVMGLGK